MGIYNQAPYEVDPILHSRSSGAFPHANFLYEYNGNLYIAYYNFAAASTKSGVYKSTNNGVTWTTPDIANSTWREGASNIGCSAKIDNKIYWLHVDGSLVAPIQNEIYITSFDMSSGTYTTDLIDTGLKLTGLDPVSDFTLVVQGNDLVIIYQTSTGGRGLKYKRYSNGVLSSATTIINSASSITTYALVSFSVDPADNRLHICYASYATTGHTTVDFNWASITTTDSISSPVVLVTIITSTNVTYTTFGNEFGFVSGKVVIAFKSTSGVISIYYGNSGTATPTFSSTNTGFTCANNPITSQDFRLVLVGSTLYCFYINYTKPASILTKNEIDYITSTDGITWTSPVVYYDALAYPAFPTAAEYPNSQFLHVLSVINRSNGQFAIATTEENNAFCAGIFLTTAGGSAIIPLTVTVADANTNTGLNTGVWNTQDASYVISANTSSTGGTPIGNGNCPPFAINIGDQAFEFYGLLKPEVVEVLPVGKKFDQVGPIRFDKLGKLLAIRTRIITTESAITLRIHTDSEVTLPNMQGLAGDYSVSIPTIPYTDDVYEVKIPKTIKGTVFRIELGPNCGIFYRYDMQIKVQVSGMQSDPKWVKVDNQGVVPYGGR